MRKSEVFKEKIWKPLKDSVIQVLKNPKQLITALVISGVWMLISMVSAYTNTHPIMRFLATITYANGGMYGGIIGTAGGIFGKVVFVSAVNSVITSLIQKKNPFKDIGKGMQKILKGGMSNTSVFLFFGGAGLLVYLLANVTVSMVNIAVAVAFAITALQAAFTGQGMIFSVVVWVLKKITKGRAPSKTAISRALIGFAGGFALSLPLTLTRSTLVILITGLLLIGAGVFFYMYGNGTLKRAAAMIGVILIVGAPLAFPVITVYADSGDYDDYEGDIGEDDYEGDIGEDGYEYGYKIMEIDGFNYLYYGRLSYKGGAKNKYGGRMPDVMDFNGDGYLNNSDYEVREKLSYNPDFLDQPSTAAGVAVASTVSAVAGSVAGTAAAAAEAAGAAGASGVSGLGGSSSFDWDSDDDDRDTGSDGDSGNGGGGSDPDDDDNDNTYVATEAEWERWKSYISTDEDGDRIVKDPVTGKETLYRNNGDGTFSNDWDSYTEEEMIQNIAYIERNSDMFRDIEQKKDAFIKQAHEDNNKLSIDGQRYLEEKHIAEAALEKEIKDDHLRDKFGTADPEEVRKVFERRQAEEKAYGDWFAAKANEIDGLVTVAEATEKVADVTIEVGSHLVPGGKYVKTAYTITKETAKGMAEAKAEGRDAWTGAARGAAKGFISASGDYIESTGGKVLVNTLGGMTTKLIDETNNAEAKGKSLSIGDTIKAVNDGMWDGLKESAKGFVMDKVTDKLKADFVKDNADIPDIADQKYVNTKLGLEFKADDIFEAATEQIQNRFLGDLEDEVGGEIVGYCGDIWNAANNQISAEDFEQAVDAKLLDKAEAAEESMSLRLWERRMNGPKED